MKVFRAILDRSNCKAGTVLALGALGALLACLSACSGSQTVRANNGDLPESVTTVGITTVTRKPIERQLTVSSELVPYQEIDVYAKESGFVKELYVDYGSRVQAGQKLAVLEIPELEEQLKLDTAAIESATESVKQADKVVDKLQEQQKAVHLQSTRLAGVDKTHPGLVAQQELDDASSKDMAGAAQVEAGKASWQQAQGQLEEAKAKLERDKVMFGYAQITAPFTGVVTQRYANLGTLMQGGTNSHTQALPLVRLSEDDMPFRLVIPVPESYVKYVHMGDPVKVHISSLDKVMPGAVKRFSMDVSAETRTMHTEVDVPDPAHILMPGMYAEATLTLDRKNNALALPLQAVNQNNGTATILMVDPNDTLQERKITLGMQSATDVEVLSGLNEGDRVVMSDRSSLKPGMHVKPQDIAVPEYQSGSSQ